MIPQPVALGLALCEQAIIEEGTKNVSLINTFHVWKAGQFPSVPRPFCLYSVLLDGLGSGTIEATISRVDTDAVIFTIRRPINFPDRLTEVKAVCRVNNCSFPVAGLYYATLLIDGQWVAQRRFRVG